MVKQKYLIKNTIWLWQGKGAWHFVTISKEISQEIKAMFGYLIVGWGSLPVQVKLGNFTWKTSIFPNSKSGSYLIPIKKAVLKTEKLSEGMEVEIELEVLT